MKVAFLAACATSVSTRLDGEGDGDRDVAVVVMIARYKVWVTRMGATRRRDVRTLKSVSRRGHAATVAGKQWKLAIIMDNSYLRSSIVDIVET